MIPRGGADYEFFLVGYFLAKTASNPEPDVCQQLWLRAGQNVNLPNERC